MRKCKFNRKAKCLYDECGDWCPIWKTIRQMRIGEKMKPCIECLNWRTWDLIKKLATIEYWNQKLEAWFWIYQDEYYLKKKLG